MKIEMAGFFAGLFGSSTTEEQTPPVPAVVIDPTTRAGAAELIEAELAKMSCEPTEQLKRVLEILKTPSHVLSGGRRRHHSKSHKGTRKHRTGRRQQKTRRH